MLLETLRQDLRYGARTLRRNPGFTGISILALALGIAVNTVVFTAYKALVARPLDATDPGSLVNISLRLRSGETEARFSYPDFEAWRDGLRSFNGVIAFSIEQLTLSDADGVAGHRRPDTGMLLQGLGLLPPLQPTRSLRAHSSSRRTTSRCWEWLPYEAIQALTMDTGYDADRVVGVTLQFSEARTDTAESRTALVNDLRGRFASVPGVTAITSARAPSDNLARRAAVSLTGQEASDGSAHATVYYTWVQSNYFDTLGIPLIRGRGFAAPVGQAPVAIVSEAAARRLWPTQDPIGRTLRLGTTGQFHKANELLPDGPAWQVIGVARDTRGVTLDGSDFQQIYVPLPPNRARDYPILLRTSVDPNLVVRSLAPVIADVDPALTVTTSTLQAMLRRTPAFLAASLSAAIASSIGLCGLLLASMGIYSAVSYDVVLRTREVGIRMAIGAQKRDILNVVMRGSLRAVLIGLALGVVLASGAARLLRGVLYGLGPLDVVSFGIASLLFLTIAFAASWVPSRRAMRIDPLVALREP